jgi:hypothetical protein
MGGGGGIGVENGLGWVNSCRMDLVNQQPYLQCETGCETWAWAVSAHVFCGVYNIFVFASVTQVDIVHPAQHQHVLLPGPCFFKAGAPAAAPEVSTSPLNSMLDPFTVNYFLAQATALKFRV